MNDTRLATLAAIVIAASLIWFDVDARRANIRAMQAELDSLKRPASKHFHQTPFAYFESFTKANALFECGFISRPKIGTINSELPYEAWSSVNPDDEIEVDFATLHEAEEWLFTQGCPDTSWR